LSTMKQEPMNGITKQLMTPTPESVERPTVGVDALNSVQSFLQQFGVSLRPTQVPVTRLPPWKTTTPVGQEDKFGEISTMADVPMTTMTSYWKRPTTQESAEYSTTSTNLIKNEIIGASPVDIDDNSTSLLKISLFTPGCHAEKSLLMLFNKNQIIQISVDTKKESGEEEMKQESVIVTNNANKIPLQGKPLIRDDPVNGSGFNNMVETTQAQLLSTEKTTKGPPTRRTRTTTPAKTRTTRTVTKRTRKPANNTAIVYAKKDPAPSFVKKDSALISEIKKEAAAVSSIKNDVANSAQTVQKETSSVITNLKTDTLGSTTKKSKRKRNKSKKKKNNSGRKRNNSTVILKSTAAPTRAPEVNVTSSAPKKRKISSKRIFATQRSV